MDSAFEHIAFLARSPNRVDALSQLSSAPATRRDLVADMDASRVTVSRALADLTDRRWVVAEGNSYRTTPTGELVRAEFERLREAVAVGDNLRDVIEWFPREWLDFDLRRLGDADVAVPTETEPTAPVRFAAELMADASEVRLVAQSVVTEVLSVQREQSEANGLTVEVVMSDSLVETVVGQERLAAQVGAMVASGTLAVYHYPGSIPGTCGVFDGDRVGFAFVDDAGRPSAALGTDDDVVRAWADETVDDYRARSDSLTASDFER
jgi:predicted transcriptional regulator